MSERMNKERAKEILKELKSETRKYMREVTRENKEEVIKICKDICEEEREALDIARESLDEITRLNQHITSLAHYWREKDDEAFKERLKIIEQEYRRKGQEDLAEYIRVQYSDCMCWVPM